MILGQCLAVVALQLAVAFAAEENDPEQFSENLRLRPLQDGRLSSTFEFVTILRPRTTIESESASHEQAQHYTLFPLAVGQLLRRYAVSELHLTLNSGIWNYASWGDPDYPSVGSGAEMWAWIAAGGGESVDQRWKGLTNGLSGLLCASMGSLDKKRTTSPNIGFRPEGDLPSGKSHQLLHATLPSENVCTENLTPFIKMLPCKAKSGIAMLLNPHRLFDADWHGMGVHVRWLEHEGIELRLTFGAVLNPVRLSLNAMSRDWSFRSVFDRTIFRSCPIATSSSIYIKLPYADPYSLTPDISRTAPEGVGIYDLRDRLEELDVEMRWRDPVFHFRPIENKQPLSVRRLLLGGQTRADLSIQLINRENVTREVLWLETMPWFIYFYLHTLTATIDGDRIDGLTRIASYAAPTDHKPTLLECIVSIPPLSTVQLTVAIEKASIAYTEHPPDASRGWDLPPAVIQPLDHHGPQRIYTSTLLGDLPTPDFSMPYNVIIMTCTLVALFFGSIFNLLTRSFTWVKVDEDDDAQNLVKQKTE